MNICLFPVDNNWTPGVCVFRGLFHQCDLDDVPAHKDQSFISSITEGFSLGENKKNVLYGDAALLKTWRVSDSKEGWKLSTFISLIEDPFKYQTVFNVLFVVYKIRQKRYTSFRSNVLNLCFYHRFLKLTCNKSFFNPIWEFHASFLVCKIKKNFKYLTFWAAKI